MAPCLWSSCCRLLRDRRLVERIHQDACHDEDSLFSGSFACRTDPARPPSKAECPLLRTPAEESRTFPGKEHLSRGSVTLPSPSHTYSAAAASRQYRVRVALIFFFVVLIRGRHGSAVRLVSDEGGSSMFRSMSRVVVVAIVVLSFVFASVPAYAAPQGGGKAESSWVQSVLAWMGQAIFGDEPKEPALKKAVRLNGSCVDPFGRCP